MCAARRPSHPTAHLIVALLAFCLLLTASLPLQAQLEPPRGRVQKAQLELVADRSSYAPGETARLAAQVVIEEGWHLQSNTPSFDYLIPTELFVETPTGFYPGEPSYPDHKMWQSEFEAEPLAVYEGEIIILGTVAVPADASPGAVEVTATLAYQACDVSVCLPPTEVAKQVVLVVGDPGEPTYEDVFAAAAQQSDSSGGPSASRGGATSASGLLLILGVGWLGGLILNLMPCVLPILSLKVFGLVQTAGQGRRHVTLSVLATASGIIVSFWALAALAIGARSAGEAVGWGIQFQNPVFVTFLAVVLVFFALNMWGLFEIPMPSFLSGAGSGESHGLAGHFGTGLFATLMATPCSAPFLGTAVGFALSQTAVVTLAVFTAVGIGMATPYLLLAATPGAAKLLPKPGNWMTTLRGVMGFLLAGTVVWLLYVLAAQIAPASLALLEITLLAIALSAWLLRQTRGGALRVMAGAGIAVSALLAMVVAGQAPAAASGGVVESKLDWVDFDEMEAMRIADEGGLVFVDVTADWCATCKVNERLVLETDEIAGAFEQHEVVAMKADWTNRNDTIAEYLADHGRYAIPFYVLYRPGREPHVFGELLSKKEVLRTLEESVQTAAGPSASTD